MLTGWGDSKQAAAVAAAFIFINSISGVMGRIVADQYIIGWLGLALLPLGYVGGWAGGRFGARRLSGSGVRRMLGFILLLAVVRFWLSL